MSRSSEEVLLIVNHVKNKKCEGSLYMMGERVAWMPQSKSTFTVSHNYADIKTQKISPDTKDKVQLQVVMYDGAANTFHFNNKKGRDAQRQDREGVKELLQQLLPKFKHKVNSELEQKNRMLQDDPELFQLYKDLVVSGVVSADEFWSNRTSTKKVSKESQQDVGVSAAFLADIKPQTDGCNGLKYNLTADIIQSIFRTYPAVKQRHAEHVPDQLSEQEFWTRFFQSHYFHRDRISFSNKDLFAECARADDQDIAREKERPVEDRLVDVAGLTDGTAGEGYGSSRGGGDTAQATVSQVNASLIKRFNQHSTRVLQACDRAAQQQAALPGTSGVTLNGHTLHNGSGSKMAPALPDSASSASLCSMISVDETSCSSFGGEPPPPKKARIREKIEYEDLATSAASTSGAALKLVHMDRYLHGPTTVAAQTYNTSEDLVDAVTTVGREMLVWRPALTHCLHGSVATSVLGELTPGGTLMQSHSRQLNQMVPEAVKQELAQVYGALCELLRHFWACFPVNSKALEEKVVRMAGNLERFQLAKLHPFKQKLLDAHYSINITAHLEEMLQAAFNKFHTWQARRLGKKS